MTNPPGGIQNPPAPTGGTDPPAPTGTPAATGPTAEEREATARLHFKDPFSVHGLPDFPNPNYTADTLKHAYTEELIVPQYYPPAVTCGEKCAAQDKLAKEHCDMVRKRVAQWFKDTGCPSAIKGFKTKTTKCGKRKSSSTSKTSKASTVKAKKIKVSSTAATKALSKAIKSAQSKSKSKKTKTTKAKAKKR